MTPNTVPSLLHAVLDPLATVHTQVEAALFLAQQYKLPGPFIDTIKASAAALDGIHDTLLDIAVALDPDLAKDQD
ncbi:unnamed protein product [marine sediment metagenome]|uniref:Uncharacterized protein n=1 Tax=marine sediment metagenome TaxID=412755 RepID=X1DGQ0_9ZZZZ